MAITLTILESANIAVNPVVPATVTINPSLPVVAATVDVGTTTTGEPGTDASVVNSGTAVNAVFDFTIPRGIQGIQGIQGQQGIQGPPGVIYATAPLSLDTGTSTLSIDLTAYATQSWVNSQGFLTSSSLDGYATQSWVTGQGYITSSALTGYATESWVTGQGYITSAALTGYATQSWVTGQGYLTSVDASTTYAPIAAGMPVGGATGESLLKVSGANYDATWGTPAFASHAETTQATVRNNTGSTLTAGQIVYINGALGNRPTVALAQANSEATSAGTYAMVEAPIADNADGVVITSGTVMNLDTQALSDGDKLYLSPTTAGAWTTTKPSAPEHLVYIGVVTRSHPTQGTIQLRIQNGYELEELHNVSISFPENNNLLAYETSSSLWKNKSAYDLGIMLGQNNLADVTSALQARTNLGLGTMATATATDYLAKSGNLSGLASTSTARTNLGLGTIATFNDAPSDGSQYARQNGAWAVVTGGGGGGLGYDVQIFGSSTTSGNFTWTKPANARIVLFYLIGGGGGGGSGGRYATTSARSGGAGGNGGSIICTLVPASLFNSTETVTVGAKGTGGASTTINTTAGSAGTAGGDTIFGIFKALGGLAGAGGTTTTASNGASRTNVAAFGGSTSTSNGGPGNPTNGTNASNITAGLFYPTSGGGGGAGAAASSTVSTIGGNGGLVSCSTTSSGSTYVLAGGTGGVSPTQPTAGANASNFIAGGTGGGGGFYQTNVVGSSGTNAGWPGGGGGGGAASDNGFNSGAGGNGSNGCAIIITLY